MLIVQHINWFDQPDVTHLNDEEGAIQWNLACALYAKGLITYPSARDGSTTRSEDESGHHIAATAKVPRALL
jgi:hypothetical protein